MAPESRIAALLRAFADILEPARSGDGNSIAARHGEGEPKKSAPPPPPIEVSVHAELRTPEAEVRERQAQEAGTARRDRWRLGVEAAALFFFIVTAVFAYRQVELTRRQAQVAEQQFEAMDRPWVIATLSPFGPVTLGSDMQNADVNVKTEVKNIGRSVAQNVQLRIYAYPFDFSDVGNVKMSALQNELCSSTGPSALAGRGLNAHLFPEQTHEWISSLRISREDILRAAAATDAKQPIPPFPLFTPVVVGCVTYQFAASSKPHHTCFSAMVKKIDSEMPGKEMSFDFDRLPSLAKLYAPYPDAQCAD